MNTWLAFYLGGVVASLVIIDAGEMHDAGWKVFASAIVWPFGVLLYVKSAVWMHPNSQAEEK